MRCLLTAEVSLQHNIESTGDKTPRDYSHTHRYLFKPNHATIYDCSQGRLRNETILPAPTANKTVELQLSRHGCRKTMAVAFKVVHTQTAVAIKVVHSQTAGILYIRRFLYL